MKLHLLVDTCVWLDIAKDYRQLPVLEATAALCEAGDLELILPQIVLEEFERNKDRVAAESKRSLSAHFRLVRDAVVRFAPDDRRDATLSHLNEVDHLIAVAGEPINDAIEIIEKLFATATKIELTDAMKARAADRAIAKIAPFHRQRNGIDDALLIETYIDALAARQEAGDIYGFVTHNIHDFSQKGGDTREPHLDLAGLFDGAASRYLTNLAGLIGEFAEDLIEEIRFEREFSQDSRKLSELRDAEDRLFRQVWYNRHWNLRTEIERGKHKLVTYEEWEKAGPKRRQKMTVDTVWERALAAAKRTEEELGPDEMGPWTNFEWGMINGKLSAIRWVMGDEWDMLDT
ncbi:PIN domain-containing protein [Phenylobacterium sp.]|uniref:PIN domain-containing protein n=1 Tax=Phenylobacterium sp. TaxID=1871053 RepID=UPI00273474BD|nr:PIN domain-containing protein [Phenylobacterium sp.]MDP3853980.1 PIN domain-containing protein [Phenylobacterium sp.]